MEKGFNSKKLSNKTFAAKKPLLLKSKVFLDPIIEKATDWTDVEITERGKWLAKTAIQKVWKI